MQSSIMSILEYYNTLVVTEIDMQIWKNNQKHHQVD